MSQAYTKPVTSRVSQVFGANPRYYATLGQRGHNGTDYAVPVGTPVRAAASGVVAFEGWGQNLGLAGKVAGIYVLLKHDRYYTGYAHLSRTVVDRGQKVKQGQIIGFSGNTGMATGPHLHFEVLPVGYNIKNGYYGRVNPALVLTTKPAAPSYKTATTLHLTNIRLKPSVKAPVMGRALKGTKVRYTAVVKGDVVNENNVRTNLWVKRTDGRYMWRGNLKI